MHNKIDISNVSIEGRKIQYAYEVTGDWKEAFDENNLFWVEYECDISKVPLSIAILPFLCNLLPMAWVYDAEICTQVCDKCFYDNIEKVKQGYIDMYPDMAFGGKLTVSKVEEHDIKTGDRVAAFFSGGVDAFNTLVMHEKEKPMLMTVWGADIKLRDQNGWNHVLSHLQQTAQEFHVEYTTIKSNFRSFLRAGILDKQVKISGDGWWHGFQHGMGIIGLAAPIAYSYSLSTIYFASSFTAKEKGLVTCASDPSIDNHLHFANTNVVHDGYEFNRQAKLHNITQYANRNKASIPLRVCWRSEGGMNCCNCEKCWRTMLGIYAEGYHPNDFGFDYSHKELKAVSDKMKRSVDPALGRLRYEPIQNTMRSNCKPDDIPKELRWFYEIDIDKLGKHPIYRYMRKWKRRIVRVVRGVKKDG